MAKVTVELHARCLVDSRVREAGEIVEIDEEIARDFGKPVKGVRPLADEAAAADEGEKK
jgi:hypothetical protein